MSSQERFLKLLRENILKLDLAELDFGIYRVLNYRRAEVEAFLSDELPSRIEDAVHTETQMRRAALDEHLTNLRRQLEESATGLLLDSAFDSDQRLRPALAASPLGEEYARVSEERARLEVEEALSGTERDALFNHLFTFLSRYYRDGDFLPLARRSRRAKYSAPYRGEDALFYWRGKGSHYVKTAEELRVYAYVDNGHRVRFELQEADVERDDLKGQTRYFVPSVGEAYNSGTQFVVPFTFRLLTDREQERWEGRRRTGRRRVTETTDERAPMDVQIALVEEAAAALADVIPQGLSVDLLKKHLARYA